MDERSVQRDIDDIWEHNLMEIKYTKADRSDGKGGHIHKYDYPAVFRIDRIKDYKETGEKFHVSYADQFEEGEFRKRL